MKLVDSLGSTRIFVVLVLCSTIAEAFHVVLAGGTGPVGQAVASKLEADKVTILTRNAFLAAAPNRVTEQFGWVGDKFLQKHPHVHLRDWDGGDLLDIVGQNWVGWQQDALKTAHVIVHLVGGFTPQRVQACERLVRESLAFQPQALHVTVSPTPQDMGALPPRGLVEVKQQRCDACEELVQANCLHHKCLQMEAYRVEQGSDAIVGVIQEWAQQQS